MIKILYTINYYSNNGPSKVLKNIILNLNQKKYDITLLTFTSGDNQVCIDELKKNNVIIDTIILFFDAKNNDYFINKNDNLRKSYVLIVLLLNYNHYFSFLQVHTCLLQK